MPPSICYYSTDCVTERSPMNHPTSPIDISTTTATDPSTPNAAVPARLPNRQCANWASPTISITPITAMCSAPNRLVRRGTRSPLPPWLLPIRPTALAVSITTYHQFLLPASTNGLPSPPPQLRLFRCASPTFKRPRCFRPSCATFAVPR